MEGDCRHRVHMGLSDVLDDNWDIEIPGPNGLVVRCCYKPAVFINEGDSVHRSQVLVVFLRYFSRVYVVLIARSAGRLRNYRQGTHLNDLFVGHSGKEDVLLIFIGVEPNHVRDFAVAKPLNALASFRIPQLHLAVISA